MRIAMIGTGYVGLVSGACFSEFGITVTCVDKDVSKIERLKRGIMPIYEPGLDQLVEANVKAGRLSFTTDLKPAVAEADAVFIAVGTPSRRGDGHADLSYVYGAAKEIAEALTHYTVVVTKSTVPVGTGREVARTIKETRKDADFDVVSNPEFLREGAAIGDFMNPDRVVIGTSGPRAREVMGRLYRPLEQDGKKIVYTTLESSELIKYAANTFLAAKITFINEIADLCEKVGADVHDVAEGIGLDSRIGRKFLQPGPGYGGSCFPKDVKALVHAAREAGQELRILQAVQAVNERQKQVLVDKIVARFGPDLRGRRFALWGLAFKPGTDDMREAPSLAIIEQLLARGAEIAAYDPVALDQARLVLGEPPGLHLVGQADTALEGADALVIVTEWKEFRSPDFARLAVTLRQPVLFDGRNLFEPADMRARGIEYHAIGRGTP